MNNTATAVLPLVERETEVLAQAKRRTFTAEYKKRVIKEADAVGRRIWGKVLAAGPLNVPRLPRPR